jgi:diguanylate cyclase (GGDEF)-like protein
MPVLRVNPAPIIQTNFVTLDPTDSAQTAVKAMVEHRQTYVLIVAEQQLVGIFTERDATRRLAQRSDLSSLILGDVMTTQVRTVTVEETEDQFAIAQTFIEHRIRHLPVVDQNRHIVGMITPQSLSRCFQPEHLLRCLRVGEVMTRNVLRGQPNDVLLTIVQRMAEQRVSCIVITNPVTQVPLGIITERDITRLHTQDFDWEKVRADRVMTQPLITMTPQDSLWDVHEQMQAINVRRLVICQSSGELAGIVTQTQMLKMMDPAEIYQVMQQMQVTIEQQTADLQRLNQELAIANQELQALATIDELTQVSNRRAFNQFLAQIWQRAAHDQQSIALLLVDLDHFKAYNDSYGHIIGDQCLSQIAQMLQGMIRRSHDLLARYGGEEFAIVLPETDFAGVDRLAQEIVRRVQEIQIPHECSPTAGYVTLSVGACVLNACRDYNSELLLEQADQALYEAKNQGRNGYVLRRYPISRSI